jgi:hypothetical protein
MYTPTHAYTCVYTYITIYRTCIQAPHATLHKTIYALLHSVIPYFCGEVCLPTHPITGKVLVLKARTVHYLHGYGGVSLLWYTVRTSSVYVIPFQDYN